MLSVRSGPYDTGARFGLIVPAQVSCGIDRPLALVSPNPSTPVAPLQVEGFYAPPPHLSSPSAPATDWTPSPINSLKRRLDPPQGDMMSGALPTSHPEKKPLVPEGETDYSRWQRAPFPLESLRQVMAT